MTEDDAVQLEKVKIKKVIGPTPAGAAVLLGNEKKTFVVFVGFYEAAALIREINHETPARPLTHELVQNVFLGFDIEVKSVVISAILESTFCATLVLQQRVKQGGEQWVPVRNEVRIDARPSDCFVLALKNKVDLLVTPDVFEQVQDISNMTKDVEKSLQMGMPFQPKALGDIDFDIEGGPSAASLFSAAGEESQSGEDEGGEEGLGHEGGDGDEEAFGEDDLDEEDAEDAEDPEDPEDEEDPFGESALEGDDDDDDEAEDEDDTEGGAGEPPRGWGPGQ